MSKIRKALIFSVFALLLAMVNALIQIDSVLSAESVNICPAGTSELFFMGEDESACYYKRELTHSNGFEIVTIDK